MQEVKCVPLAIMIAASIAPLHAPRAEPKVDKQRNDVSLQQSHPAVRDCGPLCLQFLVDRCGWPNPYWQIPEPYCRHPSGWSLLELSNSATAMGWSARGGIVNWQAVRCLASLSKHAIILHVNENHFVLIFREASGKIFFFDPATTEVIRSDTLPTHYKWNGVALTLCSPD